MKHTSVLFTLSLSLSACAIPGLSGNSGLLRTSGGGAPSSPSSREADDALREQQSRDEHRLLDEQMAADKRNAPRHVRSPSVVMMAEDDLQAIAKSPAITEVHISGSMMSRHADGCSEYVRLELADGIPRTNMVEIQSHKTFQIALGDIDAKICKPLLARAQRWDADVAQAKVDAQKNAEAPYRRVGISEDKLAYVVDGGTFVTTGQKQIVDPAELARANVYFDLSPPTAGLDWTLVRREFRNNKLVATTSEGFLAKPGPAKYR